MNLQTIEPAAKAVGLTPWALRAGALKGKYPHIMVGNKRMFDVEMLEEVIKDEMRANMQKAEDKVSVG